MPLKVCSVCDKDYFARWRNTPAVCDDCGVRASLCPACWRVELRADDPAQLALFDRRELERRGAWRSIAAMLMDHFANNPPPEPERAAVSPWPGQAPAAERRRYPYQ